MELQETKTKLRSELKNLDVKASEVWGAKKTACDAAGISIGSYRTLINGNGKLENMFKLRDALRELLK